jgi:hypothetical protein
MLRNLQSRMRPTELAYKKSLTQEWNTLKAYKKGVGSVDDWLDKWITLYQDCVKAKLPIMELNQPVDDFAEAAARLGDLTWASGLIQRTREDFRCQIGHCLTQLNSVPLALRDQQKDQLSRARVEAEAKEEAEEPRQQQDIWNLHMW